MHSLYSSSSTGETPSSDFHRNEKSLLELIENVPGLIYQYKLDANGKESYPFLSDSVEAVLGYTRQQIIENPTLPLRAVHPNEMEMFLAQIISSQKNLTLFRKEFCYLHPTKGRRWHSVHAKPTRTEDGATIWQGYCLDITNRRHEEHNLREAFQKTSHVNELFNLTSRIAKLGYWELSLLDKSVFWSEVTYLIHGLELTKTLNYEDALDFYPPSYKTHISSLVQHCLETGKSFDNEAELIRSDGVKRWVLVKGECVYDEEGQPTSLRGFIQDIHEEKCSLLKRLESEHRLTSIYRLVPGVIYQFLVSPQGDQSFPFASDRLLDVMGVEPHSVKRDAKPLFNLIHTEDLSVVYQTIETSFQTLQPKEFEVRYHHPIKGERWIHSLSTPIKQIDGSVLWNGYFSDITERKKSEEEALDQVKEAAVNIIAGGLAHDFNNYLSTIQVAHELLEKETTLQESGRTYIKLARDAVHAAQNVSRQFLSFTKQGDGKPEIISVQQILTECGGFCLAGSSIQLGLELENLNLAVLADRGSLQQVLVNLILNACQAMGDKGKLSLQSETFWDNTGVSQVLITITDTGPGIPEEVQGIIFKPFYTSKAKGTGLGLYVAKTYIERMGGTLSFVSRLGHGTSFSLCLPAAELGETSCVANDSDKKINSRTIGANQQILLLDDSAGLSSLMLDYFTQNGFHCRAFKEGQELLNWSYAHEHEPIFGCVLDLTIPGGLGGMEITPELRSLFPKSRIILMSGYSSPPNSHQADLLKLDILFLRKPFQMDQLLNTLLHGIVP